MRHRLFQGWEKLALRGQQGQLDQQGQQDLRESRVKQGQSDQQEK
jgi:hypothetical protein